MPIGVPRIIYCWGEELPAQWTDIYNFIFRRRMVFLMQYLDDELCNQICGLLINIHMEDRSKEMEKKDIEKSGMFKNPTKQISSDQTTNKDSKKFDNTMNKKNVNSNFYEDLLKADSDLGINDNYLLEQKTLQKITMDWLNWNTQFVDYKTGSLATNGSVGGTKPVSTLGNLNSQQSGIDKSKTDLNSQPYFFYLAEILSKDFSNKDAQFFYNFMSLDLVNKNSNQRLAPNMSGLSGGSVPSKSLEDVYSPFRFLANLAPLKKAIENNNQSSALTLASSNTATHKPVSKDQNRSSIVSEQNSKLNIFSKEFLNSFKQFYSKKLENNQLNNLSSSLSKTFSSSAQSEIALACNLLNLENQKLTDLKTKQLLSQRQLKKEYVSQGVFTNQSKFGSSLRDIPSLDTSSSLRDIPSNSPTNIPRVMNKKKYLNYLNSDPINSYTIFNSSNDFSKKEKSVNSYAVNSQLSQAYQEEEAKKVFMIINSFGGSVGNGITVHDALQFIKAGSMTLALGVAASAASLALAGGTIGERYVTEGCHVMIHQPEGGLSGQASDIWIDSLEIMKIRMDVAEIYSLSTYRPRHKILRDLDRDYYLSATDAIQYGLCDEIATNEVMHEIIELTSKVWDYHDTKQQRLLESREGANSDLNTQTQN